MSRKIDLQNLSDDDKIYLAQRGQLSTDVASVAEQRELLDPERDVLSLDQRANTGDVNTSNLTIDQLEALLAEKRAALVDPATLMGKSAEAAATADEDEEGEGYDDFSKADLIIEIQARNEARDADNQLPIVGNKAELRAVLEADDAEDDETEGE